VVPSPQHQDRFHPGKVMSLKAAECGLMLPFSMHLVEKFGGSEVHGPYLYQAGDSLLQLLTLIRGNHLIVHDLERNLLIEHFDMHLRCCLACKISLTPKHHLTVHMICRRAMISECVMFSPTPAFGGWVGEGNWGKRRR